MIGPFKWFPKTSLVWSFPIRQEILNTVCFVWLGALVFEKVLSSETRAPILRNRGPIRRKHCLVRSLSSFFFSPWDGPRRVITSTRKEPVTRWFVESIASIPKYNERFARRYRNEPSREFSLTLPCSGIIHLPSGPDTCAPPSTVNITGGCWCMCACVYVCLPSQTASDHDGLAGNRRHDHQNEH